LILPPLIPANAGTKIEWRIDMMSSASSPLSAALYDLVPALRRDERIGDAIGQSF
jgi:hypothetical protein